LIHSQAL